MMGILSEALVAKLRQTPCTMAVTHFYDETDGPVVPRSHKKPPPFLIPAKDAMQMESGDDP